LFFKKKFFSQNLGEWFDKIEEMTISTGKFFHDVQFLKYGSFAPSRKDQLTRWFLNASTYMEQVMNGLNNAREEIYIADWWLSPGKLLSLFYVSKRVLLD
jgi:phospholipase D1/2